MPTAKVTSKGQITIPVKVRKVLGKNRLDLGYAGLPGGF
jgi:bifunctional DNA-binding transcriptional regulator/antitoxin component of YhaV-PrlF toxin-antitoxin module